jgi:hypothetical protein
MVSGGWLETSGFNQDGSSVWEFGSLSLDELVEFERLYRSSRCEIVGLVMSCVDRDIADFIAAEFDIGAVLAEVMAYMPLAFYAEARSSESVEQLRLAIEAGGTPVVKDHS